MTALDEAAIDRETLIADLKTHLANMERFAVMAAAAGREQPDIETPGPGHEHMMQTIRRLGSGQTCTMSLRYLRAIIEHLEGRHLAPPGDAAPWYALLAKAGGLGDFAIGFIEGDPSQPVATIGYYSDRPINCRDLDENMLPRETPERRAKLEAKLAANIAEMHNGGHGLKRDAEASAPPGERELDGVGLIAKERQRHVTVEGWTPEHDDCHKTGELGAAAACYALMEFERPMEKRLLPGSPRSRPSMVPVPEFWPWDAEWWKPTPGNRIRELVKAGALIAAEIDRLKRQECIPQPAASGGE